MPPQVGQSDSSMSADATVPAPAAPDATVPASDAPGDEPRLSAPIVGVTVYQDRARVRRRGQIRLPAGSHRIWVEPLPLSVMADSLRVGGHGSATVLGVDLVRRTNPRADDTAVQTLQSRCLQVRADLAELADAEAVQREHLAFLTRLGQHASTAYATTLARGRTDATAAIILGKDLAAQSTAVHTELRALAASKRTLDEELAAAERALAQLAAVVHPDRMAAVIDLEIATGAEQVVGADRAVGAEQTVPVLLDLSYQVTGAGWSSTYDVRVDAERLTMTWYAMVTQHSGEHWPECALELSTARPSVTAAVPDLEPWYLQPAPPYSASPMRSRSAMPFGAPASMPPQAPGMSAGVPDDGMDWISAETPAIVEQVSTVEQTVTAATYRSCRSVAIPSDGSAHRATVTVVELDATLDYVTAPVQSTEAQLRATVSNTSQHTFLPGPAAVFSGDDFVANTDLQTWAPGERLELALGVDDRIRVERKLVDRKDFKAKLGSTRLREVEYRTTIANHTPGTAMVTVLDQVPVPRDAGIVVKELRVVPPPTERTELGILNWKFTMQPGASAETVLRVRVEAAGGINLLGWRD